MKYAVVKTVNGTYSIHSEGFTDLEKAIVNYHQACATYHNADDVITACLMIVDENLNRVGEYREFISHEVEEWFMA